MPDELLEDLAASGVAVQLVESGDPGTVHDVGTARSSLPPYDGPPEPPDAHAREWGAAAAEDPDDAEPPEPARVAYPDGD
jgi:hypothetical protein